MKVEGLDRVNDVPVIRDDVDTVYTENVARRLMWLEAFVFRLLEKDREFSTWEERDGNGKIVARTISEGEAYSYFFGDEEDKNKILAGMGDIIKSEYQEREENAKIDEENRKKEVARVAKLRTEQAIKAKELKELKAEGAKKRRAAYEIDHAEELKLIAQKRAEKAEYKKELEEAEKNEEEVYASGGRMKKLAD